MIEVKIGDQFQVVNPRKHSLNPTGGNIIYTVTKVEGSRVWWDCVGRTSWYKIVNIGMIDEHVNDLKDLVKI